MQIIIPMSGQGTRFLKSGYKTHKALIEVDGMPIIEHIVKLFSQDDQFIFICDKEHLANTNMELIIKKACPNGKIIGIDAHKKGPVFTVLSALDYIDDFDEVIVNYCDFGTYWEYQNFLKHTRNRNADGAIVAYKGFHPHMLGSTNYAFIKEANQWLIQIKEKEPFTKYRMDEFASNGTYYFKSGLLVKKYFKKLIDLDHHVNGEFYVSLVYNLMQEDNLRSSIYQIEHMLQWGTPEDLEEYNKWSNIFLKIMNYEIPKEKCDFVTIMPMSGLGKRFKDANYKCPKALIEINGREMYELALMFAPKGKETIVVTREEFKAVLGNKISDKKFYFLESDTNGQADSVAIGLQDIKNDSAVLIVSCDSGFIFDNEKFNDMISNGTFDAICFTQSGHQHALKNPSMYGWARNVNGEIKKISVKKPIDSDFYNDEIFVGAFWFKNKKLFNHFYEQIVVKEKRINNEFYVDTVVKEMINCHKKIGSFKVDSFLSWGTPDDLETFQYWQSFFDKNIIHPYNIDKDSFFYAKKRKEYSLKFRSFSKGHNTDD